MTKLTQNQFYCVSCRKKVSSHPDDMCVEVFKNKRIKGGVPALRSECTKCGTNLTKFIKHDSKASMIKKFGKC